MVRGPHILAAEEHLLVELLAGAHAGIGDLDVHALLEPRETNQDVGQLGDLHRLAHVERGVYHVARAEDVVGHRLDDVLLHQRHVLWPATIECTRSGSRMSAMMGMSFSLGNCLRSSRSILKT